MKYTTANGVFHDVVHTIYQGVFYLQSVIRSQDARLNVLPCPEFHETHKRFDKMMLKLLYRISPTSVKVCEKYGYKFIYAQ
jgi:hypothetical protein